MLRPGPFLLLLWSSLRSLFSTFNSLFTVLCRRIRFPQREEDIERSGGLVEAAIEKVGPPRSSSMLVSSVTSRMRLPNTDTLPKQQKLRSRVLERSYMSQKASFWPGEELQSSKGCLLALS